MPDASQSKNNSSNGKPPKVKSSKDRAKDRQSMADVLHPYLTEQCAVALQGAEQIAVAVKKVDDLQQAAVPTALVHDTRVALRRLRSILRIFDDAVSVPEAGRLSDDAGWFAVRLGSVRDLDVLEARISAAITDLDEDLVLHGAEEELRSQVRYRRGIALGDIESSMHSETYADLIDQLKSWQRRPHWAPDAEKPATKIKKYVKRAAQRLNRRLERAAAAVRDDDPDADELIHAARKAGKRHRYAVEASAVILGPSAAKQIESRRQLQDQLGDLTDSVLTSGFLRDLGGIPGRNGFTFGVLYTREQEHHRRARKAIAKFSR